MSEKVTSVLDAIKELTVLEAVSYTHLIRHKHTPRKRACLPIPAHSQTTKLIIQCFVSFVNPCNYFFSMIQLNII